MTPEEAAKIAETNENSISELVLAGPGLLDSWRAITEVLTGMVAISKESGFSHDLATEMVANQFVLNCRTASFQMKQAINGS
jgi:hypothetical protein